MKQSVYFIASLSLFISSAAWAEGEVQPVNAHASATGATPDAAEHASGSQDSDREGLMIRFAAGVAGMASALESERVGKVEASGNGTALEFQIGGALMPNFFLHSDVLVMGTTESLTATHEGKGAFDAGNIALGAAGIGATYFILPYNVGLSTSLMFAVSGIEDNNKKTLSTDYGTLAKLGVTKSWQVSKEWGLGVGGTFMGGYGHGEDKSGNDVDAAYAGAAINLVATYN